MARFTPGPQISQLSGATSKGSQTILYPRGRNTFARIKRGTPWRNTTAQRRVTELNRNATTALQSITDEQRDTWKAYAENFTVVHMGVEIPNTDLEMFISTNFHRQLNEEAISPTAPLIQPEAFSLTVLSTTFLNTSPALLISFNHTALDIDNSWFLIRASTSFPSAGRKARKCDYRLCGSMEHYSLFPVQPSPQTCFVPLTPMNHNDPNYIWIACMILSQDYYKGYQFEGQVQLTTQDCLWYASPDHTITFNQSLNTLDVKISGVLIARLFQNGNLSLKGELCEYTPAEAPSAFDYIYFHAATTQIRLAYKTKTTPGFKTILTLDADGNCNLYGELYEFMDLSPYSEPLYFHPYCNPRKLQVSVDRITPAFIFFVDDAPQNTLHLREVTTHDL